MKKLLILLLTLIYTIGFSQSSYKPQQSSGEMPEDLILSIQEKIEKDKLSYELENSDVTKVERNFIELTNRKIDKLLQSGKVLFGDEMTQYINKLAKLILEKNNKPELIDKLRLYTLKSSIVNAFTTQQGMIFFNVGLIAQVENESQLAFIISHEISHYIKEHIMESHLNTIEYINNKNNRRNKSYDDVIMDLSSYSKKHEFEADSLGYILYTNAGYNPEDATKAMSVLQYSHLPFDEIPMNTDFFNKESYKLPLEKYFSDKLFVYKDISDKDDSKSSHPNIKKRKEKLSKLASFESKYKKTKEYLISIEEFKRVQNIARLDNLRNNLTSRNYLRVVYESFLLKRLMPGEPYIDYCLAKSLYAISKLKTNTNFNSIFRKDNYEGEISKIYNLFSEQLSNYEINILALKHLTFLKDEKLKKYEDDLIDDLVNELKFDCSKFRAKISVGNDTVINESNEFKELDSISISQLTKVDRILYYQKLNKSKEGKLVTLKKDEYYLNAFITEMNDPIFVSRFDVKKDSEEEEKSISLQKGFINDSATINGLIIVEPIYVTSSNRKGTNETVSEKKSNELQQVIGVVSEKLDINYVIASREGNTENKISNYNGEAAIKEWIFQYATYDKYDILPLNTSELQTYTAANNSDYVVLSVVYTNRGRPIYGMAATTLCTIALYPVLPFMLFENLSPRYHNYIYTTVIDTKTNKMVLDEMDHTNKKLKEYNVRSIIYYNLSQLKK